MWLSALALRFLTDWGMRLPSSSPIVAWSPVAGIGCNALIDTCGGCDLCLDKIARMFGGPFSDYGPSNPTK